MNRQYRISRIIFLEEKRLKLQLSQVFFKRGNSLPDIFLCVFSLFGELNKDLKIFFFFANFFEELDISL
jgi:hypothetical protein